METASARTIIPSTVSGRTLAMTSRISCRLLAVRSIIPIFEPVDPHFVINLKAAKCLGISVPLEVLSQADEVIR
jgi:hypothetical protein